MINFNLVDGDTVLVKVLSDTDRKWKKGKVIVDSDDYYEIKFSNEDRLIIIKNYPICDISIIKVDSDFKMECSNCKHRMEPANTEPCCKCVFHDHYYWEPCDSFKNKDKLNGNDIKTFSIDEGPFTDKKVNYSYISTNRCNTVNMLERQMHEQLLASPLKIEKLDMESMYPRPTHSDYIDALIYSINDERALAEFMADFNKKENKDMKKQQKKRDRNIIKVKDIETRKIKEIMFNGPATIIKWDPTWAQLYGDKTVTVCKEPDKFDKTTGFLLAVLKEVLDNKSYGNILEKIDEIKKSDELSVEEDRDPKYDEHIPKETIALLNEAAEAMNNAFHIGSRVKYIHGGLVYMVVDCAYIPTKHEMYYTLSTCQNDILSGHETHKVYNVAHHRLKQVKRG